MAAINKAEVAEWIKSLANGNDTTLESDVEMLEAIEEWIGETDDHFFRKMTADLTDLFRDEMSNKTIHMTKDDVTLIASAFAYIHAGKSLRLLAFIGSRQPGFGGELLALCHENSKDPTNESQAECNVVLQRLLLLLRMSYFNRIFGKDNRKNVLLLISELTQPETEEGEIIS